MAKIVVSYLVSPRLRCFCPQLFKPTFALADKAVQQAHGTTISIRAEGRILFGPGIIESAPLRVPEQWRQVGPPPRHPQHGGLVRIERRFLLRECLLALLPPRATLAWKRGVVIRRGRHAPRLVGCMAGLVGASDGWQLVVPVLVACWAAGVLFTIAVWTGELASMRSEGLR